MPRSSRSKSHKQSSKHTSSSTAREYSGSDDDVKLKERSSEERKHNKDLLISHVNGDVIVSDKNHGGSDRWNGGSSDFVVNVDNKDVLKSKGSSESKSKSSSSRRHDSESVVVVDDIKSRSVNNRIEKRKYEKEYRSEKRKSDKVDGLSKQIENQSSRRGKEITDWPIEEELKNPELENDHEKRVRKREEGSSDKDKHNDDVKETDNIKQTRKSERYNKHEEYVDIIGEDDIIETRQRDEKHREDSERDRKNRVVKHRGESERYSKHRDDKYHEDNKYKDEKYDKDERIRDGKRKQYEYDDDDDRDYYKYKEDKYRDVRNRDDPDREKRTRDSKYTSRDVTIEPETKRLRDDKKTNNRDESPFYDDRVTRYNDDKDRRRVHDKEESSEYRSRSMKDQRSESLKRTGSRYVDSARDHHRVSKQEENKYRDYSYEDRVRDTAHSSRDYTSSTGQSDKKVNPQDDSYIRPASRSSSQVNKSPSSTSNEREPGPTKDTTVKEIVNEFSQADNNNDNISRNSYSHFSGSNSKALIPPPSPSLSRTGSDTSFFVSSEDDKKRSNNRHRRTVDQNMGRVQGNWKNVPNWPGGYIPFQHVPPPMFHPLMQQFPPPIFGRPPMKLNPSLPYHLPDHGQPPMHGWDANNTAFGDWDNRRTQMNNQGWDQSGEIWKGQNAGPRLDVQMGPPQDWYPGRGSTETGQADENEQNQMDIQAETLNLETNAVEAQKVTESPKIFEFVKKDNNALISKAYFSRVDVSQNLTLPELYDQCTRMMDLDQEQLLEEFDCKILFLEEGAEDNVTDSVPLLTVINDSVFQKAMLLYKKQKDEIYLVKSADKVGPPVDQPKGGSDKDGKPTEKVVMEVIKDTDESPIQKLEPKVNMIAESAETEEPMDIDLDCAVVLSADVAVMTTESIEFGSVNLNRIHHHSPESTH